jgi:hypothetical protein
MAIGVSEDSSLSQAPRELPGVASYWNLAEHLPQMEGCSNDPCPFFLDLPI